MRPARVRHDGRAKHAPANFHRMKRLLPFVLVVALMGVGCGGDDDDNSPASQPSGTTTETSTTTTTTETEGPDVADQGY